MQNIVCENDDCQNIFHLGCVGLEAMPEGVWKCPENLRTYVGPNCPKKGACSATRGCILPDPNSGSKTIEITEPGEPAVYPGSDGRDISVSKPIEVGSEQYVCVVIDGRPYFPLYPAASDILGDDNIGMPFLNSACWPDIVCIDAHRFPKDCASLKKLGFINSSFSSTRMFVTLHAIELVVSNPELMYRESRLVWENLEHFKNVVKAQEEGRTGAFSAFPNISSLKRPRTEDAVDEEMNVLFPPPEKVFSPADVGDNPFLRDVYALHTQIIETKDIVAKMRQDLERIKEAAESK